MGIPSASSGREIRGWTTLLVLWLRFSWRQLAGAYVRRFLYGHGGHLLRYSICGMIPSRTQITLGPALAMGVGLGAAIARMSRSTLLEVYREDFVRTARAKGMGEQYVIWRHVMRNALLPVITVSGLQMASLLGGSVAVERAFGVPGLGLSLVQAITERTG